MKKQADEGEDKKELQDREKQNISLNHIAAPGSTR